jgi:Outer membrane protein beta-barrel domain
MRKLIDLFTTKSAFGLDFTKLPILCGVLFLVNINVMSSQTGLILGIGGGINNSRINYSNVVNLKTSTSNLMGYQGALTVGWQFSNNFSLLSGVQYAQKGSKLADDNQAYRDDSNGQTFLGSQIGEERTNFVTIPFVARYKFLSSDFGFTLSSGLSLNMGQDGTAFRYVQSNNNSKTYFGRYEPVTFGDGINDLYNTFQVGFVLGAGLIVPINEKGRLTLNVAFDFGLSDAYNTRYKNANTIFEKAFNRSTFFTLGYEHVLDIGDKF